MDFDSPALHNVFTSHSIYPDFQPCPAFQSAVTEEFIKWVWLGLKTVIIVKMMVKNTERDNKSK